MAGFLAARLRLLAENASEVLSRFVFVVALPSLIFTSLSRIGIAEFFDWRYIAVIGGGMLILFAISLLVARLVFARGPAAGALHALTAMYSSTAYIGLPLVLTLFGDAARVPGIIGAIITGLVFAPLAILLLEIDRARGERAQLVKPLVSVILRPPVFAVIVGLAVSASGVGVAAPVHSFFALLGDAFVPCALFAAGLFIGRPAAFATARDPVRPPRFAAELSWLVAAKLLLHPLIAWWLAFHVFELNHLYATVAVMQSALPSGVPVFVLAQQYGIFVARSSAAIAISTALAVLSVPLLFLLLN